MNTMSGTESPRYPEIVDDSQALEVQSDDDLIFTAVAKILQGVMEEGQVSIFTEHDSGELTQEVFTVGFSSEDLPYLRATVARSHKRQAHLAELGDDEPRIEIDLQKFNEPIGICFGGLKLVHTWGMRPGEFSITCTDGDIVEPGALTRRGEEIGLLKQILAANPDDR